MNSSTTPVSATWMLILSNVILLPSIVFCARRAYMHEIVVLISVVIFNSMFYACQTRDICFDLLGLPLKSLKWIFHVMMFHLVNTMFIFYLDIHPRRYKAVPHFLLLILTSLLLFGSPDKEQLLVRVHVNSIIISVLVLLAWFAWLFIKEGPIFLLEKYPLPNLISGFIGIGLTALGGYAFALSQSLLKNAPPLVSPQTYFFQNGVLKPWVTLLVWHVALNLATNFLMCTLTNNIFISVFKFFDPPQKIKKPSTSSNIIATTALLHSTAISTPYPSETSNKVITKRLEAKTRNIEPKEKSIQEEGEFYEDISTTDVEAKELETNDHAATDATPNSTHLLSLDNSDTSHSGNLNSEQKKNKRKKKGISTGDTTSSEKIQKSNETKRSSRPLSEFQTRNNTKEKTNIPTKKTTETSNVSLTSAVHQNEFVSSGLYAKKHLTTPFGVKKDVNK
jgi:hypothetical protein